MNVLSIQSHVAYGHVGNASAVFPMQRLGCEVWPIHTVQFSNHTGYGAWKGRVFDGPAIEELVDGIAERLRPGAKREPVLAAWGFTVEGRRVLLHLMAGSKEDTETVTAFFEDTKRRGLNDPLLVTSDGAPGIIKAAVQLSDVG